MKPSARLVQLFRQCLADIEMLSWGTTTSWSPSKSKSSDHPGGSKPPGGDPNDILHSLRNSFINSHSWVERLQIYVKAKSLRDEAYSKPKPPQEESAEERSKRIIIQGEGWSAKDVAVAFRTSAKEIRKVRFDNSRDPETGYLDENLQLQGLVKAGVPIREIAKLLNRPYTSVHREVSHMKGK